jgi:hypothetical protein
MLKKLPGHLKYGTQFLRQKLNSRRAEDENFYVESMISQQIPRPCGQLGQEVCTF